MIQSMTGYGKSETTYEKKKIHVELKSLNSKSFDLNMRISQLYREKEQEIRQRLSQNLCRGKIDISIWIEKGEEDINCSLNKTSIKNYILQMRSISQDLGIQFDEQNIWSIITNLPDIALSNQQEVLSEDEWKNVSTAIDEAIQQFNEFRTQEGHSLYNMFIQKLNTIKKLSSDLNKYEESRIVKIREKLTQKLTELVNIDYDKNRLEQELIYYIEKLDINEEKIRLANHLKYFEETLNSPQQSKGKKLGFIAQEMGREINTTGSKSNLAEMQNIVVMMKDELEQIKEQILNVL